MNENTSDMGATDDGLPKHPDPSTEYQDQALAERYDKVRFSSGTGYFINNREQQFVRRTFKGLPTGAAIVDLPCGTGRLSIPLLEDGYRVVGADISPAMLNVAKQKLKEFGDQFTTEVIDAHNLSQLGIVFQGAVCARIFVHMPFEEQVAFLKAVADNTDGPIIITHSINTPWMRLRRSIKRLLGHHGTPARYTVTNTDLRRLLTEAGLREKERFSPIPLISEAVMVVAEKSA
jgi:2-polyprenyl-3-methyl-5-hydroxy-6-metoxy-1,4-benzoquinol methylase